MEEKTRKRNFSNLLFTYPQVYPKKLLPRSDELATTMGRTYNANYIIQWQIIKFNPEIEWLEKAVNVKQGTQDAKATI